MLLLLLLFIIATAIAVTVSTAVTTAVTVTVAVAVAGSAVVTGNTPHTLFGHGRHQRYTPHTATAGRYAPITITTLAAAAAALLLQQIHNLPLVPMAGMLNNPHGRPPGLILRIDALGVRMEQHVDDALRCTVYAGHVEGQSALCVLVGQAGLSAVWCC